jgi:hypothetical protein
MASTLWTISRAGAWIIALAATAGCVVSIVNYFDPASGIAGEAGTVLVIVSTALLASFGWLLGDDGRRGMFFRVFFVTSSLLDIIGTGLAGYLLHSQALFLLMLVSFAAWLAHVFFRRRRAAA